MNIVGEGLQRRYIDHLRGVGKIALQALPHEAIDAGEEGGKGLAGAGGRSYERVPALGDRRPTLGLGLSGLPEPPFEPLADDGVKM